MWKTSDVSKAVSWREFDKSLLKRKTLLRVEEITNDGSTWSPPSSSRRCRSLLARRLISELGSFAVPFPPPRWYWSLLVGLTSQLWGWLFKDGSFHRWGWLLIGWVFRGWPLRGWNTQRLTSPHRWDFQRLTSEGRPPQRWDCLLRGGIADGELLKAFLIFQHFYLTEGLSPWTKSILSDKTKLCFLILIPKYNQAAPPHWQCWDGALLYLDSCSWS